MIKLVDCTLRDGGYYNQWDFNPELVDAYLNAMVALQVDFVEIGFRSVQNNGFKAGFAYTTDRFLQSLSIPQELKSKLGVMINGSELVKAGLSSEANFAHQELVLKTLFSPKQDSMITLVRIACHVNEFEACLNASDWLKSQGYTVGFNLMQIAECSESEIMRLAELASNHPIDVLYFADSMGSLTPVQVANITKAFRSAWLGELGIHTHDNMNQALANSIAAVKSGITWVDSTVTGMGRGPGNVQTEYLVMALAQYRNTPFNLTKLLELIRLYFKPLQMHYGWGTNPYYYLAGQYGIHPSYIQEMIADSRYSEEDILAVIEHLKIEGGKKFSLGTLDAARHFYQGQARGTWSPVNMFKNREVVLLGAGPSVKQHRAAIEAYIQAKKPIVLALNTQSSIAQNLIDVRVACHPIRLLADCETHVNLPQPLITPASMLPNDVLSSLNGKTLLDYGLQVQGDTFLVKDTHCVLPTSLVVAYALAILTSGNVKRLLLAGFDGYGADDPRRKEVDAIFSHFLNSELACPILSITPTRYEIPVASIYALEGL